MDIKTKHKLKKIINELDAIRGRHTELVSVYLPAGYDLNKAISHLSEEQGTASNIKDSRTRNNVQGSLERAIRTLRLYKRVPPNGLVIFVGNASTDESKIDIRVWTVEPPEPLMQRIYRCDQTFKTDILKEFLEYKEVYGLVVMDRREATIGLLKGPRIELLTDATSGVPGKFKAGGQCKIFGTLVQCSDGKIVKIEKLHNPLQVKSINFNTKSLQDSNITDKWYVNKNKVYNITTKYPQITLGCSGDHLLFVNTLGGIVEKPVSELKENDQLIMPERIRIKGKKQILESERYYNSFVIKKRGMNLLKQKRLRAKLFQKELARKINTTQTTISSYEIGKLNADREELRKLCDALEIDFYKFILNYAEPYKYREIKLPKILDKTLAQFIGYYIGDGCVEKDRITFFEQRKQVAIDYIKKFGKYFNVKPNYRFRKSKNYHQIRFTSRPLVRLITNEFVREGNKTLEANVPIKIMKSKDDVVAGFLRGIFDAEGYVNAPFFVGIASINKTLIEQIRLLLLRFSIIASFGYYNNKKNPWSKKPIYKLYINEKESLLNFKKYIGLTAKDKVGKLNELIDKKAGYSKVRQVLVPGTEIAKLLHDHGYSLKKFKSVSDFFRNKRLMSKATFKRSILDYVKNKDLYKKLKQFYDCEVIPVAIDRIEIEKKNTPMVDISVQNENFIANGIISHNSAQRFHRLIEGMALQFYKKIALLCNQEFLPLIKELKGIIIGGPGHSKNEFIEELNQQLKDKIIAVQDITYTDESGLHHLVEKSKDVLAKEAITEEKELVNRFLTLLAKEPGKAVYGEDNVKEAINMGAVELVLLSEKLPDEKIDEFEDLAAKYGAEVKLISIETREGAQLKDLKGIAAILRYQIR